MDCSITRLTPPGFFLWEYLKSLAHANPVENLDDLRNRIFATQLEATMVCLKEIESACIQDGRSNFEHLL